MKQKYKDYKEINKETLKIIAGSAWSIENMAAHDAGGRAVDYIGSKTVGNKVTDYYQDSAGSYWYKNRAIVNGEIVNMDVFIFGREMKKRKSRKW